MPRRFKRNYTRNDITVGCELELGDVEKGAFIPESIGEWEWAECDIVNLIPPYRYVAADPLGIDPPVGGEINIKPTHSVADQVEKIDQAIRLFSHPTTACLMEFHVHVGVDGLVDDLDALKRLTRYIQVNQDTVVRRCVQYCEDPLMAETRTARTYLKWDMGRTMPDWMCDNICSMADSFDDFIRIQCCGKDGVSRGRPFRYTVNTYCLKHIQTVEFRCFRATLDLDRLHHCLCFAVDFILAALNDGRGALEIIRKDDYEFPRFYYDHDQYLGWEQTKYDSSRGKKERKRYEPI